PSAAPCRSVARSRSSSSRATTCCATTAAGSGCARSSTRPGTSTSPTTSGSVASSPVGSPTATTPTPPAAGCTASTSPTRPSWSRPATGRTTCSTWSPTRGGTTVSETTQATDRAPGLRQETLGALGIDVPPYDRAAVTASVVHVGVGGFHRAHQAVYLDEVLRRGELEWGICGVGLLPGDADVRDAALAQDGLYVLVAARPDGSEEARVVG